MRSLGIRAVPTAVHWAVVEGTQSVPVLVASGIATAPKSFQGEAATLAWLRTTVADFLDQYDVASVAVRYPERVARGLNSEAAHRRSRVEGVVLEAAHSKGCQTMTGPLVTIGRHLGSKKPKRYLDDGELRGLDLTRLPDLRREAVLMAVSVLPRQ
jgi:hypothetical protein